MLQKLSPPFAWFTLARKRQQRQGDRTTHTDTHTQAHIESRGCGLNLALSAPRPPHKTCRDSPGRRNKKRKETRPRSTGTNTRTQASVVKQPHQPLASSHKRGSVREASDALATETLQADQRHGRAPRPCRRNRTAVTGQSVRAYRRTSPICRGAAVLHRSRRRLRRSRCRQRGACGRSSDLELLQEVGDQVPVARAEGVRTVPGMYRTEGWNGMRERWRG